jgi:hypothetical protein
MPEHSIQEQTDAVTSVLAIRAKNRAELAKAGAIDNVMERLQVFHAMTDGCVLHPRVFREHAEQIVAAVLALTRQS